MGFLLLRWINENWTYPPAWNKQRNEMNNRYETGRPEDGKQARWAFGKTSHHRAGRGTEAEPSQPPAFRRWTRQFGSWSWGQRSGEKGARERQGERTLVSAEVPLTIPGGGPLTSTAREETARGRGEDRPRGWKVTMPSARAGRGPARGPHRPEWQTSQFGRHRAEGPEGSCPGSVEKKDSNSERTHVANLQSQTLKHPAVSSIQNKAPQYV